MKLLVSLLYIISLQTLALSQANGADEAHTPSSYRITAPEQASVAAVIEIGWQGEYDSSDYITIVPADAGDSEYRQFVYTKEGATLSFSMPMEPGTYEIRLLRESQGKVLARKKIEVVPARIDLSFPAQADAGSKIEIGFRGTGSAKDWITIVPAASDPSAYLDYAYCEKGTSVTLTAPDRAGDYEVRYVSGFHNRPLVAKPITIGRVSASLQVPPSGRIGQRVQVRWQGPADEGDYLTIVPAGTTESQYGEFWYVAKAGNPVDLLLPPEPGAYEIRYQTEPSRQILARAAIQVEDATAQLRVADSVPAGEPFAVSWRGPDGEGDYVSILRDGPTSWWSWAYTKWGDPAELMAPEAPGRYRVCYQLSDHRILAERVVEVTPGDQPGSLSIVEQASDMAVSENLAVEVVLDASGSMLKRESGQTRMSVARAALEKMVRSELKGDTGFALRVFGHRKADICQTDLEIPLSATNKREIAQKIKTIQAKNLAKTPIADSLDRVVQDLSGHKGPAIVVLLTDGEETCGGDPKSSIQRLVKTGMQVRVNVVGFSIGDRGLKRRFEEWAQAGSGVFLDASNPEQLDDAMMRSLRTPYRVVDKDGRVVAQGTVNREPLSLKPGAYHLEWGAGWREKSAFDIRSGKETELQIGPGKRS